MMAAAALALGALNTAGLSPLVPCMYRRCVGSEITIPSYRRSRQP
jgi:hypothetical protein